MSLLGKVFPSWALKREIARARLAALESRAFATKSNYRKFAHDTSSADAALAPAAVDMRSRSRQLAENHDLYVSILNELVSQIVGTGLSIEPMGVSVTGRRLKTWNDACRRVLDDWQEHPEATGELAWSEFQRRVCWAWLQDGELFIRHITSGYPWAAGQLHYVAAQLEADYCPIDWFPSDLRNRPNMIQGIEHDSWGRPQQYNFFKTHPGDLMNPFSADRDLLAVPAAEVTHLKFTRRWPQTRGQPICHACFNRLADLGEYEQAEIIAAKVAGMMTAFIQRDLDLAGPTKGAMGAPNQPTYELSSGAVYELLPGETVGTVKSERPNPELTAFRASQLRAAAAGAGVKYSTVARDYIASYSAARQEMVETEGRYMELRGAFCAHFLKPVYRRVIRAAVMAGKLELPATTTFDRATLFEVGGPGIPWIDPKNEVEADVLLLQHRLASRAQILRKRGIDPVQLAIQLEVEDAERPEPLNEEKPDEQVSDKNDDESEPADPNPVGDASQGGARKPNGDGRNFDRKRH